MKTFSYQYLNLLFLVNLYALKRVTLKKPRKAASFSCSYMHLLPFWYSHKKGCVLLVGDSPQSRGRCSSPSLPCAAPLASWSCGEPWVQRSSSLTPVHPVHPPCLHWADSYSCLRYLKREGLNPVF